MLGNISKHLRKKLDANEGLAQQNIEVASRIDTKLGGINQKFDQILDKLGLNS